MHTGIAAFRRFFLNLLISNAINGHSLIFMKALRRVWVVVLLALLITPAVAPAQFTFITNNGAITITGYTGPGGNVIIPNSTNGYPVKNIGILAFNNSTARANLTNVVIPDSVTNVGFGAFDNCINLTNVVMSINVKTIANTLFSRCGLTSFVIPYGVTSIGPGAFDGCTHLGNVTIPNSVNSIGTYAFTDTIMTSLVIPDSITSIGDWAFAGCSYLTNLVIGNGIASIPTYTFVWCTSLTSVSIPDSVTNIGTYYMGNSYYNAPFSYCFSLTNITYGSGVDASIASLRYTGTTNLSSINVSSNNPVLSSIDGVLFDKTQGSLMQCPIAKVGSYTMPGTVTNLLNQAFLDCSQISDLTINNNILFSGGTFFAGCTSLTNISLFDGVTNVTPGLFYACVNLQSFTVNSNNPFLSSIGGVLFDKAHTTLIEYPYNGPGSYAVPDGVTQIGDAAFEFCVGLTNVTLASSLASLGEAAFALCSGLTTIVIPNGVTSINDFTFWECTNLVSALVPSSVANIGANAFFDCRSLTSVYFRGNAPIVDSTAFTYYPLDPFGSWVIPVTIYCLPGTSGWNIFTTSTSLSTVPWFLPNPMILNFEPNFGIQTNSFGFTISWATNTSVVVETCTNLGNPVWTPVSTSALVNGTNYFSDPNWTNYPGRFYRVRSP